jgi:hypothetical protein
MWGGKGSGSPCDFCRVVISDSDVEYEIEADLEGQRVALRFHPKCHEAWDTGREPPASETGPSPPAAGSSAA